MYVLHISSLTIIWRASCSVLWVGEASNSFWRELRSMHSWSHRSASPWPPSTCQKCSRILFVFSQSQALLVYQVCLLFCAGGLVPEAVWHGAGPVRMHTQASIRVYVPLRIEMIFVQYPCRNDASNPFFIDNAFLGLGAVSAPKTFPPHVSKLDTEPFLSFLL